MVLGTRYDKLPYMRRFLRTWEAAAPDLESLARGVGAGGFAREAYRRGLTDGSPEDAVETLVSAAGFLTVAGLDVGWVLQALSPPEVRPSGEGGVEALFSHVPAGRYTIGCPGGAREVRVGEGLESAIECP